MNEYESKIEDPTVITQRVDYEVVREFYLGMNELDV